MPRRDPAAHAIYIKKKYHSDPAYREKHKALVKAGRARRNAVFSAIVAEAKRVGCLLCPEREHCCLGFHHVIPEQKKFNIAAVRQHHYKVDLVLKELSICVCLCENCHRKVHHGILHLPDDAPRACTPRMLQMFAEAS